MFRKSAVLDPLIVREDMDKMAVNHEFFLLVREHKYEQAYAVGTMYLQYHPDNQAVRKFCDFIESNKQELIDMVDQEENYTDGSSDEEDEESEEDSDNESVLSKTSTNKSVKGSVSINKSVKSSTRNSSHSIQSTTSQSSKKSLKENTPSSKKTYCDHKWEHVCKNQKCLNKKKK